MVIGVLWFAPGPIIGAWYGLSGPEPVAAPLTWYCGLALLLAGLCAIGAAAQSIGPITASREWRAWLLSTPLDRGALFRGRVLEVPVLAALPGSALGALLAFGTGARSGDALAVVILGAVSAAAVGAAAVVLQGASLHSRRIWWWIAGLLLLAAVPLNLIDLSAPKRELLWWAVAPVAALAVIVTVLAVRTSARTSLAALAAGAGAMASLGQSVVELSLEPLSATLRGPGQRPRPVRLLGHGRSDTRLSGTAQHALRALVWQRTLRDRRALARFLGTAAVPYATWILVRDIGWGAGAVTVLALGAGTAAVSGLTSTMREFARQPLLADRYGLDPVASVRTAAIVPVTGAVVWGGLTAPAIVLAGPAVMAVLIPMTAAGLVLYRAAQPPYQPSFAVGRQYSLDLVGRLFKGPAQLVMAGYLLAKLVELLIQR